VIVENEEGDTEATVEHISTISDEELDASINKSSEHY